MTQTQSAATGPAHGSNIPRGEVALAFIKRVENLDGDIQLIKDAAKEKTDALKLDQDQVYVEARIAGFDEDALKAHVRRRKIEAKAAAVREKLKGTKQDSYDALQIALDKIVAG